MMRVSILGCGWLGFSLATHLKIKNYKINASTTSKDKYELFNKEGFNAFLIDSLKKQDLTSFLECEILIICIPTSKLPLEFLKHLLSFDLSKLSKVILISTTSIYPNENKTFDEEFILSLENCGNIQAFQIEEFLRKNLSNLSILRCAGLMGYDRIPIKYFHNKILKDKNKKVNFVHRDDVISAIETILNKNIYDTFNLCAKLHPTKEKLYKNIEANSLYSIKEYQNMDNLNNRIIKADKITKKLHFSYKFDNPFNFFYV
ncbi:hypothetical protein CRU99_02710 [Malaciobacter mytili]|nr:hypothetical protein CRU99_02710 [Malaciobacter mytili]